MWLKVDDEFEEHPKVKPLSDAAHRLWMRAACWCQKTGSNGFVPRAVLSSIAQNSAPLRRLEKLAEELVLARAGGVYENGLWELADGGWVFHDWAHYQPEAESKPKLTRSEAASIAGKASAKARAVAHGTSQPVRPDRTPNEPSNVDETFGGRSVNVVRENVQRTARTSFEPPDPDPDPDQIFLKATTKDLTGLRRAESPAVVVAEPRIPCPKDLRLTDDQRGALETSMIPGWAIDEITARYVAAELADSAKTMPLVAWRKCLSKAISGGWNDPKRRPQKPTPQAATPAEKPRPRGEPGQEWHQDSDGTGYWFWPLPKRQQVAE